MSAPVREVVEADLTWIDGRFRGGFGVEIGGDGSILSVGETTSARTRRLTRRALLPGFVSSHSHAFQRGLRAQGESFPSGAGSFWTWREAMYDLVRTLTPERVYDLSLCAYEEMLDAGITCVGEFHYVRHAGDDLDHALDDALLASARDAGIRLVLIPSYYRRGGFDTPLSAPQRRFETPSTDRYWARVDDLAERLADESAQSIAASFHSVRSASPEDMRTIGEGAARRGLVLHAHLEEQRREVDECLAATGRRPLRLALDALPDSVRLIAVHATHATAEDLDELAARGGGVCLCPLTEASLGDGAPDLPAMRASNLSLSIGTDSNARLSMLEEMRTLEYAQRLRLEERGVLLDESGRCAPPLLEIATRGGAEALGSPGGVIAAGAAADLVSIDLDRACLRGATAETLAEALVFGAGDEVIDDVCVGGVWRGGQSSSR